MSALLERVRNLGYPTFEQLFNSGAAIIDDIDDFVEIWEKGEMGPERSLKEALGFTSSAFADWRHPANRVITDHQDKVAFLTGKTAWNPFRDQMPTDTPVLVKLRTKMTPQLMHRLASQPHQLYRVGPDGNSLHGAYGMSLVLKWAHLPT